MALAIFFLEREPVILKHEKAGATRRELLKLKPGRLEQAVMPYLVLLTAVKILKLESAGDTRRELLKLKPGGLEHT